MKVKRKYYPKRGDQEFILCSFNDIKFFALNTYLALSGLNKSIGKDGTVTTSTTYLPSDFIEQQLHNKLKELGVKLTRKQTAINEKRNMELNA